MADDLKARYFEEHIREKTEKVLGEQRKIFRSRQRTLSGDPSRGEMIRRELESLSVGIKKEGGGIVAELAYPVEIRFFDMKRILDWKVYNRRLWGMAYKELLMDIKHEFRDWLRRNFPEQLRKYGFKE